MGWRELSDDSRRWIYWLALAGGAAVAIASGTAWAWWAWFWTLVPPLRFLGFFIVAVGLIWAFYGVLRIRDRYFPARVFRIATKGSAVSIHHARWVSVKNADVTLRMQDLAASVGVNLQVTRRVLGDPFPGEFKELVVTYSKSDGLVKTVVTKEGQELRLP